MRRPLNNGHFFLLARIPPKLMVLREIFISVLKIRIGLSFFVQGNLMALFGNIPGLVGAFFGSFFYFLVSITDRSQKISVFFHRSLVKCDWQWNKTNSSTILYDENLSVSSLWAKIENLIYPINLAKSFINCLFFR